jgi:hypothetical protein
MKKLLLIFVLVCFGEALQAQELLINADVRMRYEHRNGYGQPRIDSLNAASFVVQRTRLNFLYSAEKLTVKLSPQSVRVWGEAPSGAKADVNGLQMFEAWLKYSLTPKFAVKAGRQELNYDDARILGNADWNMQARSHDAVLLHTSPAPKHTVHVGAALNAAKESNFQEPYSIKNQYKNMQFLWYKGLEGKFSWTLLLMNQGLAFQPGNKQEIAYNQTFGGRTTYAGKAIDIELAAFAQTGRLTNRPLNAYMFMGKAGWKTFGKWKPELGFEYLSGKDQNDESSTQRSFNPWYGTNHKFNGYMDYFYVGNHLNSTGLKDVFAQLSYTSKKWKLGAAPHYFASAAGLYNAEDKLSNYLGTELDITFAYKILPDLNLNGGYSKIWITDSMIHLKGGQKTKNQWVFLALHCNPELLNHNKGQKHPQ